MNVLVIAPHPDDESIGCGGSIAAHTSAGDRVATVFLASGEFGDQAWPVARREREAEAAAEILGIAELEFFRQKDSDLENESEEASKKLRSVLESERPDLIYLPHQLEAHPDHRVAFPILEAALDGQLPTLRLYEVWTPLTECDDVTDISEVIERKLAAIRCYESQLPAFRYDDAALGLNQYRGALSGHCRYAEAFKVHYPSGD